MAVIGTGNSKREVVLRGGEENTSSSGICGVGVPGGDLHETISRRKKGTRIEERQNSEEHSYREESMQQTRGNSRGSRR